MVVCKTRCRRAVSAPAFLLIFVSLTIAQGTTEFRRTLAVSTTEPLILEVEISSGDLQIVYGHDGEVSVSGTAKASADGRLDDKFFPQVLSVRQEGNHLSLRHTRDSAYPENGISVLYRIDVPYRTELIAHTNRGRQTIRGIMGPLKAITENGDIQASYVTNRVQVQSERGSIDLQVIGGRTEARTTAGNISCERIPQGVTAENGDGDITLMVVGPSTAFVNRGTGRVEIGGARGSLIASTAEGDLHIKAIPHDDWKLTSSSGTISLELPPQTKLTLDATTATGDLQIDRDDIAKPQVPTRHVFQEIDGGGKHVEVATKSGRIVIR